MRKELEKIEEEEGDIFILVVLVSILGVMILAMCVDFESFGSFFVGMITLCLILSVATAISKGSTINKRERLEIKSKLARIEELVLKRK